MGQENRKGQQMKMNDMGLPDITALVAFGKLGVAVLASRMLSLLSLVGIIALGAYSVYAASWQGAAVVGVVALLCFIPALKSESKQRPEDAPPSA